MAETLTELVARISTDATELKRGLSEGEKATEASSKKMSESLKKVGVAMAASGAAITAALGLMGKAAIDEEINIKRLATTINNSGTAYDKVKDSLEAVIATTQRKTGVADDEQRNILNRLILVTNDYGKALELLPTVLDLAAAGEMDATTAATYLGKAFLELEDGAEEVSVRFGQASLQFKNMEDIQNRVAGSAENLANPLSILKATMGDVAESIGSFLIPTIKDLVNRFAAISDGIQNWIKLNPELVGQIVLSTAKLGLLLLTIGSIIVILPKIVGFVTMLTGLMGPWGWAILAVAGVVGYLVAELLGLSKVMSGIKDIMAETEKQMFILRAEQALSAEEWAKIKEQGYLTEQQFISLAKSMKLTTAELSDQMTSAGLLQVSMTSLGDTNIYLTGKTQQTKDEIKRATDAMKEFNITLSGSKVALASATQQIGDTTYRTQLFTQAEVDAAKAAGAKIEMLEQQSDVMLKDAEATEKAKAGIDDYTISVDGATTAVENLNKAITSMIYPVGGPRQQVSGTYPPGWGQPSAPIRPGQVIAPGVIALQRGGIVTQPTMALLGEGGPEAVIPLGEGGNITINFTQPVFFDREDTMNRFVDMISKGIDRKQRLRFGGAYGGS